MGFNEFGQSLAGIIIFVVAVLVAFGGFQNQELFEDQLPNGITGPNDVNNYESGITVSSTGTPFGTPTGPTPNQDNNPWLNIIFNDFGKAVNLFSKMVSGLIDALTYAGVPKEIIYVIGVPMGIFAIMFLIYFVVGTATGLWRGG